jgi:ABC-type nitrate/sulfonate/bicarbonate transport system substrate-binding protein
MLSGEIAVANSGQEALLTARLAGADIIGLATTSDHPLFQLYAAPGMTHVGDLRDKRVAITRLGSATSTVASLLLQRNGLAPDRDVAIIQTGGVPEIFAALQSGAVDAGILSPPTAFAAAEAGYPLLADTTQMDIPFHQGLVITTGPYLASNEDLVRRVLRAYLRGIARYKQDKAYAKQVLGQYTKTDDDGILEQTWAMEDRALSRVPYPSVDAIKLGLDQAAAQYPDASSRDPREFFDDRILHELESNGFVASLYR